MGRGGRTPDDRDGEGRNGGCAPEGAAAGLSRPAVCADSQEASPPVPSLRPLRAPQ